MVQTKTAVVNDIEMRYSYFGNGKRYFVILPGVSVKHVTDSAAFVEKLFSQFTEEFTVYLFDSRENPPEHYSIDMAAKDTVKIMKSLEIKKAVFYGASMGGMIAQYIGIFHKSMAEKIILASSASRLHEDSYNLIKHWAELSDSNKKTELAEAFADYVYSENTLEKNRELLVSFNKNCTDSELKHFNIMVNAILTLDAYKNLEKIKCPVFVLGSNGDKTLSAIASYEIAEKLNCKIYMYGERYGHAVYDEAPDFTERILAFAK